MEIKIIDQKDNPVLSRTRIKFEIHQDAEPVPSRAKVVEGLASKLKKDANLITVRTINADFGSSNIRGEAILYSSKKALEKLEPDYSLKRLEAKEKAESKPAPKAEEPKEPKPEEQVAKAPVEEKPAESKAEDSKEIKEKSE